MGDGARIVQEVAAAVGLAEGERGVRGVIAALVRLEPVSTRRLSLAAGLPVPIGASVCGELRRRAVVADERPSRLTDAGRALFAGGGLDRRVTGTCATCAGRGVVVPSSVGRVVADVARAAAAAPPPELALDQCHCTVETKVRRVLALHEADALVGRRVLLLGDDDLVSVALAGLVRRLGSDATLARLAVVDVDPAVLGFVRRRLARDRFPVACVRHDLRDPLPASLRGAFDTVVTDPPYTVAGGRLFLSRAAEALAGGGDVFLSFGSRRPDAAFALQRAIGELGFVVRRLARDFNAYVGAGVLGGTSDLYHLTATGALRPTAAGRFDGPLYTGETGP